MSEDITRDAARAVGSYLYYALGSTTLTQLKNHGIIPKRKYEGVSRKKPDALLTYHGEVVVGHRAQGTRRVVQASGAGEGDRGQVPRRSGAV
jgi:hypothetical protein